MAKDGYEPVYSFSDQFVALFLKSVAFQRSQKKTTVFMILAPLALLGGLIGLNIWLQQELANIDSAKQPELLHPRIENLGGPLQTIYWSERRGYQEYYEVPYTEKLPEGSVSVGTPPQNLSFLGTGMLSNAPYVPVGKFPNGSVYPIYDLQNNANNITNAAPLMLKYDTEAAMNAFVRERYGVKALQVAMEFNRTLYDPPTVEAAISVNVSADYYSYKQQLTQATVWILQGMWKTVPWPKRNQTGCGIPSWSHCYCCDPSTQGGSKGGGGGGGGSDSNGQIISTENCCNFQGCTVGTYSVDTNMGVGGIDNKQCVTASRRDIGYYNTGIKDFPKDASTVTFDVISFVQGVFLSMLGLLYLPIFVGYIVAEKEDRVLYVMKMMGLRTNIYWLVHYIFDLCIFLAATVVTMLTGYLGGIRFFTQNGLVVLIVYYVVWAHALIGMCFFIAVFFNKKRRASILSFMLVIGSAAVSNILVPTINSAQHTDLELFYYSLFPPLAWSRGIFLFSTASVLGNVPITLANLTTQGKLILDIMIYMAGEAVVFFLLTFYLEAVVPRGYGVKLSPWFFLTPGYWADVCNLESDVEPQRVTRADLEGNVFGKMLRGKNQEEYNYDLEPFDVRAERQRVYNGQSESVSYAEAMRMSGAASAGEDATQEDKKKGMTKGKKKGKEDKKKKKKKDKGNSKKAKKAKHEDDDDDNNSSDDDAEDEAEAEEEEEEEDRATKQKRSNKNERMMVRVLNLRKVYSGRPPKVACANLTIGINKGECFGMLGPNGAGKTTAISMLSGLFGPTSGTAYVHGYSIRTQMDRVHMVMGVCPQHDVLWGDQTPKDHLRFYGRLKNMKGPELEEEVHERLKDVNLVDVADNPVHTFSGGMKRRLSVAIALVGHPQVVFLDEPTTGLDPRSRHELWEAIKKAKKDKALILTTHSMEEADYLCDRIGIMAKGVLRCIGESSELKQRYGAGYKFSLTVDESKPQEDVDAFLDPLLPGRVELNNLGGTRNFEVPRAGVDLATVFDTIEAKKSEIGILDWGISQTTLEEVFLKISQESELEGEQ